LKKWKGIVLLADDVTGAAIPTQNQILQKIFVRKTAMAARDLLEDIIGTKALCQ